MTTIFDAAERQKLIDRIEQVTADDKALWGEMNVFQMLEHNIRWEELMAGRLKMKRKLLGYLFGKVALNGMIWNEEPLKHSIPTFDELRVKQTTGDVEAAKQKWISLIGEYAHYAGDSAIHPFMGKLSKEQLGRLVYKHTDHH